MTVAGNDRLRADFPSVFAHLKGQDLRSRWMEIFQKCCAPVFVTQALPVPVGRTNCGRSHDRGKQKREVGATIGAGFVRAVLSIGLRFVDRNLFRTRTLRSRSPWITISAALRGELLYVRGFRRASISARVLLRRPRRGRLFEKRVSVRADLARKLLPEVGVFVSRRKSP
jgi:hypothetical protein